MAHPRSYVRFRYSEEQLRLAIDEVQKGVSSQNAACKKYNIPKATLSNKLRHLVPLVRKMGPPSILSKEEEDKLENWIIAKARLGFPMHPNEVESTVQKIMRADGRQNPFKDDEPGKKWMQLFLKRRPLIARKNTGIISKARASVTEESIRNWFSELNAYLIEERHEDIFTDPTRVFNADETGMQFCPKTGKLLGPKSYKNFYTISSGPEKESMTVLCNFSASGAIVPPMIVVPFKRVPRDITNSVPDSYFIGRSDSGWMISETFYEYITNCFDPWLSDNNIQRPVILFLDGHKSHISVELYEFCTEKLILLYCLPPDATHIMQPCDVSIFKPLKTAWKRVVHEHQQRTNKYITKSTFAPLFQEAFSDSINGDIIKNGFRCCGIYPLDPNAIDFEKTISFRRNQIFHSELHSNSTKKPTEDDLKSARKVLEYYFKDKCSDPSSDIYNVFQKCAVEKTPHEATNDNAIFITPSLLQSIPIQFDDMILESRYYEENGQFGESNSPIWTDNIELNDRDFWTNDNIENETGKKQSNKDQTTNDATSEKNLQENGTCMPFEDETEDQQTNMDQTKNDDTSEKNLEDNGTCMPFENKTEEQQTNMDETKDDDTNEKNSKDNETYITSEIETKEKQSNEDQTKDDDSNERNFEKNNCDIDVTNCDNKKDTIASNVDNYNVLQDTANEIITVPKMQVLSDIRIVPGTSAASSKEDLWKKCLLWPRNDDKKAGKKGSNVKMPFALTSATWKNYHDDKIRKKNEKEMSIKKKAEDRKRKAEEKKALNLEKLKKKRYNKENKPTKRASKDHSILDISKKNLQDENEDNLLEEDDQAKNLEDEHQRKDVDITSYEIEVNDFVIVLYEDKYFPGQVTTIQNEEFEVTTMEKAKNDLWKWPAEADKIWYSKNNVLEKIAMPKKVNSRSFFEVKEMRKYFD